MAEPKLVADCVKAMCDAVSIDVTVKHRIGIDAITSYDFVRDFVGTVAAAGSKTFIVHARNAILKGLSPKENREIPPLRYEIVYQLKRDFPDLEIMILSDDINWCREHFVGKRFKFSSSNDPFIDLCLMSLCDYHIISNSSFSWWGSWLAKSKKTIAPKNWFTGEYSSWNTKDLYRKDWITL